MLFCGSSKNPRFHFELCTSELVCKVCDRAPRSKTGYIMADDGSQQRLQAALRFATEAGTHGDDPSTANQRGSTSASDRAWLREAIGGYASDTFNPVDYMKGRLRLFNQFLNNEKAEGDSDNVTEKDVYDALEEISDNCDHYDLAADLHKIGGFDLLIQGMQHGDQGISWRSCEVLAVAVQNHAYCQNALIEMKGLPIILGLIDNTSAENKVREKAFYALSCLVRGNENVLDHLDEHGGFSVLIRAMQSDLPRLRVKSVFFVRALCDADCKYSRLLHQRGLEEQIVGMLRSHEIDDSPENLNILENLLGCLCTLVLTNEESKLECSEPRFELSTMLKALRLQLVTNGDKYEDCVKFCDMTLDACFSNSEADATDR